MGPTTKNSKAEKGCMYLCCVSVSLESPSNPTPLTFFEAKTEVKFNIYSNINRSEKNIQ